VLHVPAGVGGHPGALARAERAVGLRSWSVALDQPPFGIAVDEVVRRPGVRRARYESRRLHLLVRALRDYDVIHYNFGRGIAPRSENAGRTLAVELALFRRARKGIAVTFQGDDARQGSMLSERYERSLLDVAPDNYGPAVDRVRRRRAALFAEHADVIFFLNPDLAHVLPPRARFLPYASVDPSEWPAVPLPKGNVLRVAHAPSDPATKGTADVRRAVDMLSARGMNVALDVVADVSRQEVRRRVAAAHVFVDQLYAGWYGGAAVEAMATGRPVLAYIRDEDLDLLPAPYREALPIVRTSPEQLADDLARLAQEPSGRLAAHAEASRRFAEEFHDPRKIARETAAAYESIMHGRRGP
jgi:glycosyltransferase involved in cell wall biosynthesis